MITHRNYNQLTSLENLFQAWSEFRKGKRKRKDVQIFERNLEDNIFELHRKLKSKTYQHGSYQSFFVHDPKLRHIHKAEVLDRIIHHLLYSYLYELFDSTFIYDSYSCRLKKGTHRAVKRLEKFTRIVSKNYTKDCWALKLDIRKFFASINHQILSDLLRKKIKDENILWLLEEVIDSFCTCHSLKIHRCSYTSTPGVDIRKCKGIPLGNLTSQIFANIYMNELDQFVKHDLKIKYYLRYADDFIILGTQGDALQGYIDDIAEFLKSNLKLELHPKKIILRKLNWGIDFLGYIVLPHYILPRTKTKRRLFRKVNSKNLASYLGYLSHANSYKIIQGLKDISFSMIN